jgi:two-component system CheB/CheR fusion protein
VIVFTPENGLSEGIKMPSRHPRKVSIARPESSASPLLARAPPARGENFLIVGIGASAGGLDACRNLLDAFPAVTGMAFIFIQHLDPTHESLMVDLLASHTSLNVLQAADGMTIEREHFYVIPPGTSLSVGGGSLHVSQPLARHGARLPFDFLLQSLAEERGARAVGVVLSGTGADGSLGIKAIMAHGGLVIAQDPAEAAYDGMPRGAIATGVVDLVLSAANIPNALLEFERHAVEPDADAAADRPPESLRDIIELLRTKTAHDFRLYKTGTLRRRIERRMGLMAIPIEDMDRYLAVLRSDKAEIELLAKDLLINVTNFFRDPSVFDFLAQEIIPGLIHGRPADRPLRIWIAGCSSGEETYSLAMVLREAIATEKSNIKLQIFASDIDTDAVALAREGLYPHSIEADVSPARLARFFSKEERGYRISSELRAAVVLTVQDVLADPPFSRLDLISCRNLMIYLGQEAQAKLVSIFHFALREGGILLLGKSETIGGDESRFAVISKSERLYKNIGRVRTGHLGFSLGASETARVLPSAGLGHVPPQLAIADLCRRLVMEHYAPAAVLINRKQECLYSLGPTDRYLRVPPGHPTQDLLAMAPLGIRTKLRAAIQRASQASGPVVVAGGRTTNNGSTVSFSINVLPVRGDNEELLLICFIDQPGPERKASPAITPSEVSRVAELDRELAATRTELQDAIRNLEISNEEQTAINEEALSLNEEFQSTNEELLTSKEELQSLNEELTALNSQLQETLERQRTTSNDLQNILNSTNVATLFLDRDLNIRFFTPATKLLFPIIPSDVGRPLEDFKSLSVDGALPSDAREVLRTLQPLEREIEARSGAWYIRRVLPYRTNEDGVEGVVITFIDVTERKQIAADLEAAKEQAEWANLAKSRFLAAASHDLRQPLQTLALLQGLLAKKVEDKPTQKLIELQDQTLGAMSGMLNTLLDINQIDAGIVVPNIVDFSINDKFNRLRDEFSYHAQAKGLELHVVLSTVPIRSDRRLLEQMIRNLLGNAVKYTKHGKILLGCRRREGKLSIEIWDTGIGIPDAEIQAIFNEFHQIDNPARERSRGLGLGLSVVQRLGNLLGHEILVRSQVGKGSVFSIEVPLAQPGLDTEAKLLAVGIADGAVGDDRRAGTILIVEDDPDISQLLVMALKEEGHHCISASNGNAALAAVERGPMRPDLILSDHNLPDGMNGAQLIEKLREKLHGQIPAIILSGDISTGTARGIALQDCVQFTKPVNLKQLASEIQRLLPKLPPSARALVQSGEITRAEPKPVIFVVDDDGHMRASMRRMLEADGRIVEDYATCEAFLDAYHPGREACLLVDAYLPGMKGLELLKRLGNAGQMLPAIMITGNSDVSMAVQAMKAGASDFIEKPVNGHELLTSIDFALDHWRDSHKLSAWREAAATHLATLTSRQRQIMELVLAGHPSKNIAADLGISQRTVENHRASIMRKTGAKSLPALARTALAAAWSDADEPPA